MAHMIDYTYGDLPDDEIAEHKARKAAEEAVAWAKDAERWRKARNFTWKGGM